MVISDPLVAILFLGLYLQILYCCYETLVFAIMQYSAYSGGGSFANGFCPVHSRHGNTSSLSTGLFGNRVAKTIYYSPLKDVWRWWHLYVRKKGQDFLLMQPFERNEIKGKKLASQFIILIPYIYILVFLTSIIQGVVRIPLI